MNFIDRLNQLMQHNDISAYKLAKIIDISESTFSKWQKNPNSDPSSLALYKLSKYFQVNMEWLLTGEGKMHIKRQVIENLSQSSVKLAKEELELMKNYHKLNDKNKGRLLERLLVLLEEQKSDINSSSKS